MKAKDIMTTAVISVPVDGTVETAIRLMLDHHVSALPVLDAEKRLAGLISEGDLMRRVKDKDAPRRSWWLEFLRGPADLAHDFVEVRSQHVADVMTREVVSVDAETPVGEIARLLQKHRIKRVPVLRNGGVVGIVSRSDLLHVLSAVPHGSIPEPSEDDRVLRERIASALAEIPGVSVNLIDFAVEAGNVSIWGVTDSDFEERAIRVAAENVDGVRSVKVKISRLPAWAYGI